MSAYADCAGCGKRIRRSAKSRPDPMCRPCATASGRYAKLPSVAQAPDGGPAHGTRQRYDSKRWRCRCDACRSAKSAQMQEYAARKRAETGLTPWQIWERKLQSEGRERQRGVYTRECAQCGAEYRCDDPRSKFCSHACYVESRRPEYEERRERSRRAALARKAVVHVPDAPAFVWLPEAHPVRRLARGERLHECAVYWGVLVAGPCAWCDSEFVGFGGQARYCSSQCSAHASEARRGAKFHVQPRIRYGVYTRDRYICAICDEPTDPAADPLSDWFPSLDHIVPQSKWPAGKPGRDDPDNLRTAHRWCNAVRGNGDYYDDEDLRAPIAQ